MIKCFGPSLTLQLFSATLMILSFALVRALFTHRTASLLLTAHQRQTTPVQMLSRHHDGGVCACMFSRASHYTPVLYKHPVSGEPWVINNEVFLLLTNNNNF